MESEQTICPSHLGGLIGSVTVQLRHYAVLWPAAVHFKVTLGKIRKKARNVARREKPFVLFLCYPFNVKSLSSFDKIAAIVYNLW